MRTICLIRHGEPDFPDKKRCCLGRLDLPISEAGRKRAALLQNVLIPLGGAHVFCSPLKRCTETAEAAGFGHFDIIEDFAEVDTGLWDGLTFDEIRQKWPEEYKRRGEDEWNEPFPGGESLNDCFLRASAALDELLMKYPAGDLFIFAHRGVIQALYAHLTQKSREEVLKKIPDYCMPIFLLADRDKVIAEAVSDPENPLKQFPDEEECAELMRSFGTPQKVIEHGAAVKGKSEEICSALNKKGFDLNTKAACAAAMLHDIERTEKRHAAAGAKLLFENGYYSIAPIVADHMELPAEEEFISEKSVVFLADKLIINTVPVPLEERYLAGRDEQTLLYAKEKLHQAERVREMVLKEITDLSS